MYSNTLRPDYHKMAREGTYYQNEWETYLRSIEQKIASGEAVFVTFRNEKRREGSIGKIVELQTSERTYSKIGSWSWHTNPADQVNIRAIEQVKVGFDDRKNVVTCSAWEIDLLPDRAPEEGTVYKWTQTIKPKAAPKVVYDRIGEPVAPGDFVSFVHKLYGNISLKFGTITRITDKGTVFVQTLKLKDGDRSEEVKCNQSNVVIVNDQLMKRLVMAKLAAN